MEEQIFDILGIGNREDSYIDLISYSFNNNPVFRKNILSVLNVPYYDDWITLTRVPITIRAHKGRKKDVPDLMLINNKRNSVILIEAKIHSGEGWGQTQRYSNDVFKDTLINYLTSNDLLENRKPEITFFYLTLDGDKPSSNEFNVLKYSDVANCIPHSLENTKKDILLNELKERLDEYYDWESPKNNEIVIDYLKKAERLVTLHKAFYVMADSIDIQRDKFKKEFYVTANPGCSYIPLCIWYKDYWKGVDCNDGNSGSNCYNIHLELQWNTCNDKIRLYLHYETNPYMTQKELKGLDQNFVNDYQETRNKFFEYARRKNINHWNFKKYSLMIANVNLDANITFDDFSNQVRDLILDMSNIIDDWFK